MLTTASKPSPHARLLVAAQASARHRQQCRGFRLGPWAPPGDPDTYRDACRRHSMLRSSQYMEALSRKLGWGMGRRDDRLRAAMSLHRSHASGDYVDVDKVKTWSGDLSGMRPGRNIEDVEREAIDHLFAPHNRRRPSPGPATAAPDLARDAGAIDPITNRRIPVPSPGPDARTPSTSEADKVDKYAPAKSQEADVRASKDVEETPDAKGETQKPGDLAKYSSPTLDDPNAPPRLTEEEKSKQYQDLDKYKPVGWREPDGLPTTTPEEESKNYDDLGKYSTGKVDDADVQQLPTPGKSKAYSDLDKYKPVTWREPSGLPEQTPEELSKKYSDVDNYGPVTWNEPDGLAKPGAEEESKRYKDLGTYEKPFVADDAVLEAHEEEQQDATPKAQPIPTKVEAASEDPAKEYDDLDKYGPAHWNEPDGLGKLTAEELSKEYDDLHKYRKYDNAGPAAPHVHPEEASKQYEDLPMYKSFPNQGRATGRINAESASKEYWVYPAAGYEEPETDRVQAEEPTKSHEDVDKYRQDKFDWPSRAYPVRDGETNLYTDLSRYKPVQDKEPDDGKPRSNVARDGLASSLEAHKNTPTKLRGQPNVYGCDSAEDVDSRTADDIRAEVLRRALEDKPAANLQRAKSDYEVKWDATSKDAQDSIKQAKRRTERMLTGNYGRDLAEEFVTSWSTANSASESTLYPKDGSQGGQAAELRAQEWEREEAELSSMDESFPSEVAKLDPAVNDGGAMSEVERRQAEEDPYSKEAQGLQTSYAEECGGRSTWPTAVRHYGAKEAREARAREARGASYKVLAYDEATGYVSVAETRSGVDEEVAVSPASVLPRLSNAAKFLPHFGSLEAQGYELASGGGDVLVFRKVRPGTGEGASRTGEAALRARGPAVNPIDMMGSRPVTGNFASPTGFVNYEALADRGRSKPWPPSSAAREEAEGKERPGRGGKKSVGRRLVVGTVWVAGIAYAAGVLGEYFATGGLDGLGPRGL